MKNDYKILVELRNNARKTLTTISRKTGIPVTTIFEKLKKYESSLISKHTSLINFEKLGFQFRVFMTLQVNKKNKEQVKQFLAKNHRINSLFRTTNGTDFIVEVILRNLNELENFNDKLQEYNIKSQQYYVMEEIKREAFLSDMNLLEIYGENAA